MRADHPAIPLLASSDSTIAHAADRPSKFFAGVPARLEYINLK